jgi:GH35 family endo-1,4-beta-xylanase
MKTSRIGFFFLALIAGFFAMGCPTEGDEETPSPAGTHNAIGTLGGSGAIGFATSFEYDDGGFEGRIGGELLRVIDVTNKTATATRAAKTGTHSLLTEQRDGFNSGPALDITQYVKEGYKYEISLWIKLYGAAVNTAHRLQITTEVTAVSDPWNMEAHHAVARDDFYAAVDGENEWFQLKGTYRYNAVAGQRITIWVEGTRYDGSNGGINGASNEVSFYIDDVIIKEIEGPTDAANLTPPLKNYYQTGTNTFLLGSIASGPDTSGKRHDVLARNFGILTLENALKPEHVQPSKGVFELGAAKQIIDSFIATDSTIKIHGHTLAWHDQTPNWMNYTGISRDEGIQNLKDHIRGVINGMKDYSNIVSWDVVNEILSNSYSNSTDWRTGVRTNGTPWVSVFLKNDPRGGNHNYGTSYTGVGAVGTTATATPAYTIGTTAGTGGIYPIDFGQDGVFEYLWTLYATTKETLQSLNKPDVLLFYNDYSMNGGAKMTEGIRMVNELNYVWRATGHSGLLVDGIGMQGHYTAYTPYNTGTSLGTQYFYADNSMSGFWQQFTRIVNSTTAPTVDRTIHDTDFFNDASYTGNTAVTWHFGTGTHDFVRAAVSELDPKSVTASPANGVSSERDDIIMGVYLSVLMKMAKKTAAGQGWDGTDYVTVPANRVQRVTFWALDDVSSWLAVHNPALFDRDLKAKPAAIAVQNPDTFWALYGYTRNGVPRVNGTSALDTNLTSTEYPNGLPYVIPDGLATNRPNDKLNSTLFLVP